MIKELPDYKSVKDNSGKVWDDEMSLKGTFRKGTNLPDMFFKLYFGERIS